MSVILALDQGTTSSRAILFDHAARILRLSQQEFPQLFPQPGWVEHDPEAIWSSQLQVARQVLKDAGLNASDVAAIGITNQRETTVVWDRATGKPIHHAIVWQDRRTSGFCDELKSQGHAGKIAERTGLVIDAYFSGSKIRWILDHVPGARAKAEAGDLAFGTIDTWLTWKLTKGRRHVTDVTNASRTMLFDIHKLQWDDELLRLLEIPRAILPEVLASSEVAGNTDAEWLGGEIPIAGIAGDQHAALFGQACHQPGQAKNTYGTGCFMLMNTGEKPVPSQNKLLTTVAWKVGGRTSYALEGSVFIAGAAIQWLRDQLGIIKQASEVEELARSVPDNGGVYFVPAFAGLGAPHWDSYARGAIMGLTRGASKGHLARAALEAIAFQTADVLRAMELDSGIRLNELRVDGGASRNALLMQIQADLMRAPVIRPVISETTALGAAYLAGLATGYWSDASEIARNWAEDVRFTPQASAESVEALSKDWRKAVEYAKGWMAD